MSQANAYKEKDYTRSFVLLDNLLVLNPDLLHRLTIPTPFVHNLSRFFIAVCKLQSQENSHSRVEASVYGCLYLVLLLIHRSSSDRQIKKDLMSVMFTNNFILSLSQLEVISPSDKMVRVIAMVLTFVIRHKSISQVGNQLKKLTLELLEFAHETPSKAYLCVVLRKLCPFMKATDI